MQNYDGKFELDGQEYLFRAKDDSESTRITKVNYEEHHYRMVEINIGWFTEGEILKGVSFICF